jgi:hypothetical protein
LRLRLQWQGIEREGREGIYEQKIRCAYLPPEEKINGYDAPSAAAPSSFSAAPTSHNDEPVSIPSILVAGEILLKLTSWDEKARFDSVRSQASHSPVNVAAAFSTADEGANGTSIIADRSAVTATEPSSPLARRSLSTSSPVADTQHATTSSSSSAHLGYAGLGNANSASSEANELRRELAQAKADIERLKHQIQEKDEGLRQRGSARTSPGFQASSPTPIQQQPVEGVPHQIVFAMLFGVFIFTWFVLHRTILTLLRCAQLIFPFFFQDVLLAAWARLFSFFSLSLSVVRYIPYPPYQCHTALSPSFSSCCLLLSTLSLSEISSSFLFLFFSLAPHIKTSSIPSRTLVYYET